MSPNTVSATALTSVENATIFSVTQARVVDYIAAIVKKRLERTKLQNRYLELSHIYKNNIYVFSHI